MRILTLREPFATLIAKKIKKTETRSWRTNYRGEIYIHAGIKKPDYGYKMDDFINITNKLEFKPGYVLCKCNLVDCVEMTEEYIDCMKKNNYTDYICGEYKVGRFAWVLEDVKIVDPFFTKGRLGIWHFDKNDEE